MECNNKKLGVSFELPEAITVRDHLRIRSQQTLTFNSADWYIVQWHAVKFLFKNWKCELIPSLDDFDVNDKNETDIRKSRIITWACDETQAWLNGLESVEKN